jgi:hypothetical protein
MFSNSSRFLLVALGTVALLAGDPARAQNKGKGGKAKGLATVMEVFHVAYVGRKGAAESRELLLELFKSISDEYNRKIEKERAKSPQTFEGDRVRVLRRLDESDDHGKLYLAVYNGGPSVISLEGDEDLRPGSLSPALLTEPAGEHQMKVTRKVRVKNDKEREPALEVVDEKAGGAVTFFGIPVDGESSSGGNSGGGSGGGSSSNSPQFKTVSEEKTMPKFNATVSTRRLDGGPPKMSQEVFVSQLKNGEVYSVNRPEKRRCQTCRGFKRITSDRPVGQRDPDGKMPCPECKATGDVGWDVTYRVMW